MATRGCGTKAKITRMMTPEATGATPFPLASTNEEVPGQLHIDDAHLLPVEEVEAVREGARIDLVHLRLHAAAKRASFSLFQASWRISVIVAYLLVPVVVRSKASSAFSREARRPSDLGP